MVLHSMYKEVRKEVKSEMSECCMVENLMKYLGRTVTIFTTSGGCSGCGFTGVLAFVNECVVKLITDIGAAPACPIGSTCMGNNYGVGCNMGGTYGMESGFGGYSRGRNYGNVWNGNVNNWSGWFGGYSNWNGGNCGGCCGVNPCGGCGNSYGGGYNNGFEGRNWLGSVTEIPINRIASFTHNAI